ncbi:hypothetical protein DCO58_00220 [Helicobacter saguini]|uniref:DUF4878 domain-containing protein n=1 Tax=Helicobacter saguini TaxID=1548018 RepID=A0A347VQS2_9HELI|nr:hypothetical protein [Helicobacter saguini]MWV63182.1 hypothetical protein [Helicobacter saguini]MWV66148.1 hypothetical protein [Helicobacter saguini]MWV68497.1 hypothetical protein [Helicobacter saguini]MWV71948.1 hypothetical protein [Helicobacter saguini]TLD95957.1 hypothetical protein LS64_000935 [Helicobacter saguini]
MVKWFKGVILSACVAAFVGCSSMPSCDDDEVKQLLTKMIKDEAKTWHGQEFADKISVSYSGFMTNSSDEKAQKITCKVEVKVTDGKETNKEFIDYTAQHTSDNMVYVEILH